MELEPPELQNIFETLPEADSGLIMEILEMSQIDDQTFTPLDGIIANHGGEVTVDLTSMSEEEARKVIVQAANWLSVDLEKVSRTYEWDGPVGKPGEGKVQVKTYPSNLGDHFALHIATYADGKLDAGIGLV